MERHQRCLERDPDYEVVSCEAGTARFTSNRWVQQVSPIQLKVMQHILSLDPSPAPINEVGHTGWELVTLGATVVDDVNESLDECMDWSASMGFSFERTMMAQELCDWALSTMYPNFGAWCPWGIQVLEVSCPDWGTIVNHRAIRELPLDLEDPAVADFCRPEGGPITASSSDTPISIPDDDDTGITSEISVAASGTVASVTVDVDIVHTYRGDLLVDLLCPDGTRASLHAGAGGSADNLQRSYDVNACNGGEVAGSWRLHLRDRWSADVGTLNSWSLEITR